MMNITQHILYIRGRLCNGFGSEVTNLSLQRPAFHPRPDHVVYKVDRVAVGQRVCVCVFFFFFFF
jgi:hypothetical protein